MHGEFNSDKCVLKTIYCGAFWSTKWALIFKTLKKMNSEKHSWKIDAFTVLEWAVTGFIVSYKTFSFPTLLGKLPSIMERSLSIHQCKETTQLKNSDKK